MAIKLNEPIRLSTRGNKDKEVVRFKSVVDTIPELDSRMDVLTWKRMAMRIIKKRLFLQESRFRTFLPVNEKEKGRLLNVCKLL